MSFDAGLNAALASLGACAMLLHVSRTGLGIYSLEHHRLAALGQILEVRLEAFPDLPPPGCTPADSALASFKQAPVSSADAMELGSNNMAARKRGLVIAMKLGRVVM